MIAIYKRIHRGEDGSMIIALLSVIVAGALLTALLGSTIANHRGTRFDRDFTHAVHAADVGVQRALYMLDEALVTAPVCPLPPAAQTGCPQQAQAGSKTATWRVLPHTTQDQWIIRSTGLENGAERTVDVVVSNERRFPSAIYTEVKTHVTGSRCVVSYEDTVTLQTPGNCPSTGKGTLRSGGTINPPGGPGTPRYDGPLMQHSPLELAAPENMEFITDRTATCTQVWRASSSGGILDLTSGEHCYTEMYFDTDTAVIVPLDLTSSKDVFVAGRIEFSNKAKVRVTTQAGCTNPSACTYTSPPAAAAFRVYSSGRDVFFGKAHEIITGAYFAPLADCRGNQSMPDVNIYGALVCATLKTNGNFALYYDVRIDGITKGLEMLSWTECRLADAGLATEKCI